MIYHGDAIAYIKETPDILSHLYENKEKIMNAPALSELEGAGDIIIVGTGSSYNAGVMVRESLQYILRRRVSVLYPSELEAELMVSALDTLVIGISQQGTSIAVIEALDKASKSGKKTIAMTGEENTEITRHSDYVVMIECGEEDAGATTKGFSATAFTLLCLALELAGKNCEHLDVCEKEIAEIPDTMRNALNKNQVYLESMAENMAGFKQLIIISSDSLRNLTMEIALKFSETCRKPVMGMDSEVFCHGMYNAVQDETTFLIVADEKDQKIIRLEEYYHRFKNPVFRLDVMKYKSNLAQLFATIICIQYLFVLTSRKMGINLNIPKDPDFHKIMGSKIEM